MMKGITLGITLMFAAGAALATGNQNQGGCIGNCPTTNNEYNTVNNAGGKGGNAEANAKATANANAKATATVVGVQGQGQSQKATANNEGNKQDTEVSIAFNEAKQRLQAPGHGVGGSNATAICVLPIYGGLSVPGGALSFGGTYRDEICTLVSYGKEFMETGAKTDNRELFTKGHAMVTEAARRVADMYLPKTGETTEKPAFPDTNGQ